MVRSTNSRTGPGSGAAPIETAFFLLALALAGIHLYLGLLAPFVPSQSAVQFVVIAMALLVGPLVSLTRYWRPVLYLLGSALAVYLGVIWLLAGMEYFAIGVLTGIVATAFVVLGVYLFVRESTATVGA